MSLDLNDILLFTKLVETKSFTAAADQLGIPKSKVSRRLSQLEDALGVRLVQRTTRQFSLTDIGAAYYKRCAAIVGQITDANQFVTDQQVEPRGRLRITMPADLGSRYLGQVLARFLAEQPEVKLEVRVTDRVVDLIEEGFDLAIRVGLLSESKLATIELCTITVILCASPAYLARHGSPELIEDLDRHQHVLWLPIGFHSLRLTNGISTHEMMPPSRLLSDHYALVRDALIAGSGIGAMTDFSVRKEIASGQLVQVLPSWSAGKLPVSAVFPARHNAPPRLTKFVEHLRREFDPPPWERPTT